MTSGIVLGHYGWPKLCRLHLTVIRELCGQVPVLVVDDGSPTAPDLARVCEEFQGVMFSGRSTRLGHYAGDLAVLRSGLLWARDLKIEALIKLSMRMIFTRPWLPSVLLLLDQCETVIQSMTVGSDKGLFFRTEAMGCRIAEWTQQEVIVRLCGEKLNNPTELLIHDVIQRNFGGRHFHWPGLAQDRYVPSPGVLCHCSDSEVAYRALADSYGLELDDDFHVAGHDRKPGWVRG